MFCMRTDAMFSAFRPAVEKVARERHVAAVADQVSVGMPQDDQKIGPIANENQYKRVVSLIDGAVAGAMTIKQG